MVRWAKGEQTVQFLVDRNRLEGFEAEDLAALTETLIGRVGDVDGAFVAAYDGYRMTAEVLLARQALRATGGDGSHIAVEDAVSEQFGTEIPAFAEADVRTIPAGTSCCAVL